MNVSLLKGMQEAVSSVVRVNPEVTTTSSKRPLRHHWSYCVGAGRAYEALRRDWQEQLQRALTECGFRYVRFHGLFHDDMFVIHSVEDGFVFNWQYIDAVFDRLLEIGVRPFVELGFMPGIIAKDRNTVFWWGANGSMPTEMSVWESMIENFTQHCLDRYGEEEVSWWWFEVWNEPNHHCFFTGTRSDYFELYKRTVLALRKVNPRLRVGGPSTANFVPDARFAGELENPAVHCNHQHQDQNQLPHRGVWIEEFLAFCAKEALPVDFVSVHPYPMDWASDGAGGMRNYVRGPSALAGDLRWLRSVLAQSAYPTAEIHCTEWNLSSAFADKTHDELCCATFVAASNAKAINLAESVSYWTFTDIFEERGGMPSCFHGGFGMLTTQGIPKAVYHVYQFLNKLGDSVVEQGDQHLLTCSSSKRLFSCLLWNLPFEAKSGLLPVFGNREPLKQLLELGEPRQVTLECTHLDPRHPVVVETIGRNQGSAVDAWRTMGEPEPPTPEQVLLLRRMAEPATRAMMPNTDGSLRIELLVQPWEIVLVRQIASGGLPLSQHPVVKCQPMQD